MATVAVASLTPRGSRLRKDQHGLLDRRPHAAFSSASRLRPPADHNSRAEI